MRGVKGRRKIAGNKSTAEVVSIVEEPAEPRRQKRSWQEKLSREPKKDEHSVPVILVGPPPPVNASERATP